MFQQISPFKGKKKVFHMTSPLKSAENRGKSAQNFSLQGRKLRKRLIEACDEFDPAAVVLLDLLVQSYDRMNEARELIARYGVLIVEKTAAASKIRINPAISVEKDSRAALVRCWLALGFNEEPPTGRF
jgi:hypothetical protein